MKKVIIAKNNQQEEIQVRPIGGLNRLFYAGARNLAGIVPAIADAAESGVNTGNVILHGLADGATRKNSLAESQSADLSNKKELERVPIKTVFVDPATFKKLEAKQTEQAKQANTDVKIPEDVPDQ